MNPLDLNIDISSHDASRPLLPDGQYAGQVKSVTVEPSKAVPGNYNLVVVVATTEPNVSTKGTTINPGFEVKRWFPLQASEKQIAAGNAESFKDSLALLIDGLFNTTQGNRPALNQELITQMHGKPVLFSVKVRQDDQYGDSNDLGRMVVNEG